MNKIYLFVISLLISYSGFAQITTSKYEAERYFSMSGVNTESTTDVGGGWNVGRLEVKHWVKYKLDVTTAGTYTFSFRVAGNTGGQFEVRNNKGAVLKTVDVPKTGGWQKWTTVKVPIELANGRQTIQIYVKEKGWNFNWFEVGAATKEASPVNQGRKTQPVITFNTLPEKTVDDVAFALVATSTNTSIPVTFTSSNTAVVSLSNASGKWMATVIAPGTANITASQAANKNYSAATNVIRTQVVKAAPVQLTQAVISFNALPEKTEDAAAFALVASSTNTSTPVTFASSNPSVVSVSNATGKWMATIVAAGTANITASQVASSNYLAAVNMVRAQVVKAAPVQLTQAVITFNTLPEKTVGDAAFALVASSTNTTTPITFTSSNPAVVSVSNATGKWMANVLAPGTANITAYQAASNNYLAATNVVRAQVVKAPVTSTPPVVTIPDGTKKSGILTLADYNKNWMYLAGPKPETSKFVKIMDGVLNEKITVTWNSTLRTRTFWMTFPLKMEMTLEKLRLYDYYGDMPDVKIWYIKRDATKEGGIDWTRIPGPVYKDDRALVWDEHNLAQPLDIYAIVFESKGGQIPPEVEITGSWKPYTPAPYKHKAIAINSALKTNGYIWNIQQVSGRPVDEEKMGLFKAFTGIRDYVDWVKIEKTKGQYTFNQASEGGWKYDMVYERLKNEGIDVHACFKTQPGWALAEFGFSPDNNAEYCTAPWTKLPVPVKPLNPTPEQTAAYEEEKDKYEEDIIRIRETASSYTLFCQAAFQFVARYGANTTLNPDLVKVASNQVKKIGLNYLTSIECNNEVDAAWHGRKRYMTPREFAYYMSAFYDGHLNTMGPGVGIKNADPNMIVVASGLANNRPDYFQAVIETWKEIRGYKLNAKGELVVNMACDVWNYHAYSNNGGGQYSNSSWGLPPELSNCENNVKDFLQVISEEGNDLPVWITEVGYGVNGGSQQALATPTRTKLQSQGDWTIRTVLFNIRHGIAETYFYQAYDESTYVWNVAGGVEDNGTYSAMGLIDRKILPDGSTVLKRRPAADYMRQMQLFRDFVYQQTVSNDPIVDIYEYDGKKMYALAVPDMVSRTKVYTLDLGTATKAYIYRFADGAEEFVRQEVPTIGGKLTLTVTETPMFVTVTPITNTNLTSVAKLKTNLEVATANSVTALNTYPNPVTKEATIEFVLPTAGQVRLEVYDLKGKLVKHLYTGKSEAGAVKSYTFNAQNLADGMYVVRLVTGEQVVTKKIIVAK